MIYDWSLLLIKEKERKKPQKQKESRYNTGRNFASKEIEEFKQLKRSLIYVS